ncbi:Transcriptional repressor Mce3R [Gordonia insulae]|uniref:Transcriptional repressor Mce3R n=1 Tax=Gordonia insulae TaxID=2420509 RepID=A0A3G8JPU9_9ACTN|nr:Transcriptional repressor Mce3R [Gordonia insulae]
MDWTPKARVILDAASELFYDQGIHAVGVEAIAARAGVTKRTLYDRFGSKERLVVEYLRARDRSWRDLLQRRLDDADDDPAAQLSAVFGATRQWSVERSPNGCSMINAHAEIHDATHPAYPIIVGQKRWMLELFTRIATDAGVTDPDAVGDQLLLLHEGSLVTYGMSVVPGSYDVAEELGLRLLAG